MVFRTVYSKFVDVMRYFMSDYEIQKVASPHVFGLLLHKPRRNEYGLLAWNAQSAPITIGFWRWFELKHILPTKGDVVQYSKLI